MYNYSEQNLLLRFSTWTQLCEAETSSKIQKHLINMTEEKYFTMYVSSIEITDINVYIVHHESKDQIRGRSRNVFIPIFLWREDFIGLLLLLSSSSSHKTKTKLSWYFNLQIAFYHSIPTCWLPIWSPLPQDRPHVESNDLLFHQPIDCKR